MANHACCTFLPAGVSPIASMVVIFLPVAAATGVTHERIGCPSSCTVQAPQSAIPQPNLVPVRPTTSRSTHRIGMSAGTSTVTSRPLMFRVAMSDSPGWCLMVNGPQLLHKDLGAVGVPVSFTHRPQPRRPPDAARVAVGGAYDAGGNGIGTCTRGEQVAREPRVRSLRQSGDVRHA